jgi:four helix bundle protein
MMPYERFHAWQHCHRLALLTYRLTQRFPKAELYGITSQMRRAATSAAATIAEGAGKRGRPEFRRFLDMALGSLSELKYFALLARDLNLLSSEAWNEFEDVSDEAGKTTMGLYKAIARGARPIGRFTSSPSLTD